MGIVVLLLVIFLGGLAGDPPPDERSLAVFALALWLFVPLGWWVDRHRAPRAASRAPR